MKPILLLWGAALTAQAHDIPFGPNVLRTDRSADLIADSRYVELKRGAVTYRIADSGAPPVEIATPVATVQPCFAGDYRIEVKNSGESVITPLGGEVKVSTPAGTRWIPVGKKLIVRDSPAGPDLRVVSAVGGWRLVGNLLLTALQNASISVDPGSDSPSHEEKPSSRSASGPPADRRSSDTNSRSAPGTRSK